jgi:FecR protein
MNSKRILMSLASVALFFASVARGDSDPRSAYSYVRESIGSVTVVSEYNGSVEARRNLPISVGDVVRTDDPGRAEVVMADGNLLQIGGGTQLKFASLSGQQGSEDDVSALDLSEGSVILSVVGNDEGSVPRVDTSDATVYAGMGSRVRVNADIRRGTSVVVRAGSVEVRTRAGSYTVRAGNYLTVKEDEEPEIARGDFSRDRFDGWAADRLEVYSQSTRSASSQYVGEDYAGDVQALDGYGDWEYNSTYSSNVWRPRVSVGWSPYSYGSWYNTPIGLTWWSWDPWGWYPFHYGNWFYDSGWNSWCWSPGYVYSPAWVYWGYSGSYLGWCPVGYYGFYSPWYNNYYRQWGYPRGSMAFAINGRFSTRRVDLRGWNFAGAQNIGGRGRVDVIPGTRVVDRLGSDFSVSSRPIVLSARNGGNVREALREHIREAPRTIERASGRDSAHLEPVLARDARLPSSSVEALRERAVVADRGRLSGPGARELAPRGTTVVERGQGNVRIETKERSDRSTGRTVITDRPGSDRSIQRAPEATAPDRGGRGEVRAPQPRAESQDSWRSRPGSAGDRTVRPETQRPAARERESVRRAPESRDSGSPRRDQPVQRNGQSWRDRSEVPPARRVIDGAVPGRRAPESSTRGSENWREAPAPRNMAPREREVAPREAPRERNSVTRESPPERHVAPREAPRERNFAPRAAPRERDVAPRNRGDAPPAYRSAPREAPRSFDRAPAPPPRQAPRSFERAPAPAPRAPQAAPRSAPPRSEPRSAPPRSAPPPSHRQPRRS